MHVSVCASGLKYVISVYVCCVCVFLYGWVTISDKD